MQMSDEQRRELFRKALRSLPGYPWLPCPICKGTGSCDHIAAERAQAAIPGLILEPNRMPAIQQGQHVNQGPND